MSISSICSSGVMSGTVFQNVHLKSKVLYTDYLCKIIDQQQGLFNFDRFVYNFG